MTQTADPVAGAGARIDLADRYRPGSGPVLLTGVQAVGRLIVEQRERDERAGLRTATFVSGYQGSPLAGLDKTLAGLRSDDLRLLPGLNEELGATAVWGSQSALPGGQRTHDGVVGLWYGKGPGVDRSGDAIRHASTYGVDPRGGVLALAGDDPGSSSSTLPCVSERALAAMGLPVLYPRDAEEMIALGLYGIALSRASGCWVGVKVVTTVADGLFTVDRDFADMHIEVPRIEWEGRPWTYRQRTMLSPTDSLLAEADLFGPRWATVEAFGAANPLDVVEVDPADAWLGIAAPGTTYDAVRQALLDLGLDQRDLERAGIRLMRIGMPYPLGAGTLRRFARGLRQILVVEEKTSFVESQVRDLLYGSADAPAVLGKRDADGRTLVPAGGLLNADRLTGPLRGLLAGRVELAPPPRAPRMTLSLTPVASRTPYFCSGCPHNRSTVLPEGSLGAGGIGCHTMVTIADRESARVTSLTQMGGEGTQWLGQSQFTDVPHIFQNVGDGTFFHSGQLALQACVAAGVNITYKILYNQVVAMTGAQDPQGALSVPALTRKLHAEGVARIIVCSETPRGYGRRARFAPGTLVWHRDRLDEAQRLLRDVPGVTVLVYDQQCAAEARRLRKRGRLAERTERVVINESVCEGCGDCGVKSNCLSVQPVETELGRKTRIDQTSCNTDYTCLQGDCPSFVTVRVDPSRKPVSGSRPEPPSVADPVIPVASPTYDVFLAGIGGTGIVTVNAVLATAALHDGLRSVGLDQTGLSQKAGPVTSHLRISVDGGEPANRISTAGADTVLAFDLLVGTDAKNLVLAAPDRTVAIASTSRTPTGEMVYDAGLTYPDAEPMLARLRNTTSSLHELDALGAAEALFGSTDVANLLVVGAAFQAGALPLTARAIERAIALNGVKADLNTDAFRWGRVGVADPAAFARAISGDGVRPAAAGGGPDGSEFLAGRSMEGETARLAGLRAVELRAHSGADLARRYVDLVETAWTAERAVGEATAFSEAVARGVHRLWAYKDEYEVARLLTAPAADPVAGQVPGATKVTYNLHPPMLRSMGVSGKLKLGPWFRPVLRGLAKGRVLRGTPLDPFGFAHVRRLERALAADYRDMVAELARTLDAAGYDRAVQAAGAAELVRGYEGVKLANVERYRERRGELGVPLGNEVLRLLR
ncbi:indolepyruvate ferredoxin oxidoreductase family protein [Streptosporangium sp. NBC_01755]|uniref:indolepyruvate ferredoxin oxidoreductase family protein n=1 Tax=unclassified Streptosporangium TaxID=2632669 RepID=UPI002DD8950B|nr:MULTISPECIES: indolepyruvate ferredoxin oxidoreductase family protein [unclassified Streptosporangium]WSA25942.1 indolepyruvate ferredoxin oxidoreductase family protein [Streptosporangium sp. NBC_01810]WSD02669.1 indolepyruvate ferredoxin oxidoreductase family protein [Streptosporangium sp. NBC_01755]